MRRFSLYKRGNTFYARFWDPTLRSYGSARSTGETEERAALAVVALWEKFGHSAPNQGKDEPARTIDPKRVAALDDIMGRLRALDLNADDVKRVLGLFGDRGLVAGYALKHDAAGQPLVEFLRAAWGPESAMLTERTDLGRPITESHRRNRARRVEQYYKPFFKDRPIVSLSVSDFVAFRTMLRQKGLAPGTIKDIMNVSRTALKWAHAYKLIETDPSAGVRKPTAKEKNPRGILTPEETAALFQMDWLRHRSKVAAMAALTCGLRAGELSALRVESVMDDRLHVKHSYNTVDGLKDTKTREVRYVPLLAEVRNELRTLATANPYNTGFVFWRDVDGGPVAPKHFAEDLSDQLCLLNGITVADLKGAKRALQRRSRKVKADPADLAALKRVTAAREYWRGRGVCFHSFRHQYATMLAGALDAHHVMKATGHKSEAVFKEYARHATAKAFAKVATATQSEFGTILNFPEAGAI